jgi:hypothetical protein
VDSIAFQDRVIGAKAVLSSRAPADQSTGAKDSKLKGHAKGQESPGTKVPPPMATQSQTIAKTGSGAGGFRGVDGLGQTEIGVLQMATHSKT